MEAFKKSVDKAVAGDQLGVLLRGLKKGEAKRGMILTKPGSAKLYNHIETQVCLHSYYFLTLSMLRLVIHPKHKETKILKTI